MRPSTDLPFVAALGKRRGVDYWAVTPTGDYTEDCRIGGAMAFAYLRHVLNQPRDYRIGVLQHIVFDIAKKLPADYERREDRGIVVGFFSTIGSVIAAVVTPAHLDRIEEWEKRRQAWFDDQPKRDAAERSERARKAALIGAAKRRKAAKQRASA